MRIAPSYADLSAYQGVCGAQEHFFSDRLPTTTRAAWPCPNHKKKASGPPFSCNDEVYYNYRAPNEEGASGFA